MTISYFISGNVHHNHDIITTSKVMALQNKYNKSDIGGGPVMDSCAINAALKGTGTYTET